MFIYLDNSSTTKQYDQVTEEMTLAMKNCFGNPSSLHRLGFEAEKQVRSARKKMAKSLGCKEEEVYFTSCGTESDNTVLYGVAEAKKRIGKRVITSQVEHPAVLEACKVLEKKGFEIVKIGVDSKCRLNMEQLQREINDDTILISIMTVNNENGTIMPIREIGKIKDKYNKEHGTEIILHTDAVQAYGKVDMNMNLVDAISISGHKIHGPKGIGGLYLRKGMAVPPFIVGGGQEKHMRSGTENTPAIIGLGKAIELSQSNMNQRVAAMSCSRKYLLEGIKDQLSDIIVNSVEDDTLNGEVNYSSPSVLNISFLGTRGEVLLHTLEQDGIYVSTGSACSSNKQGQSHVLSAMGLKYKEIEGALRFSFSEFNTIEEMDYVLDKLTGAVKRFRKLGSYR